MNPITTLTHAVVHPVRTAGSVADQALGIAAAGARMTAQVIGWAVDRTLPTARDEAPDASWVETSPLETPLETQPAAPTATATPPARKAPASRPPARKAPARRAPSAKAATAGPAVAAAAAAGEERIEKEPEPEAQLEPQLEPEPQPLVDPAMAKAIRSEATTLQKAADLHKD